MPQFEDCRHPYLIQVFPFCLVDWVWECNDKNIISAGCSGSAICLQVEAEEKAAVSAKEGLSKKLRDAEQRAEMLQDQITELEMSLERQRASADARCVSLPEQHLHAMLIWIT